ncbi:adenylate kinase 7-like, partial [Petaurus breviceps papuanus]|uniref:adenylate kinase 7-like n=1 Tax=Petaurus breviceps papuanus TaxID=3040969 RepID=UPI0036DDC08D
YLSNCIVGASLEEITEEEDDDDESKSAGLEGSATKSKEGTYQIVGTLSSPECKPPEFALETYTNLSREELLFHLLECDVIIYNITENMPQVDEAMWAVSGETKNPSNNSTLPSLPTTSPDSSVPPQTSSKELTPVEKEPTISTTTNTNYNLWNRKFSTYVIASGLIYGAEEGILHLFFKMAWLGETPTLPVFGDGTNIIPAIHVLDLAGVLQNIADHVPKVHYLIAMDEASHTQEDILKCISKNVGPGKIQKFAKENAFLSKELTQGQLDHLLVNLRMEALFVKENFNIRWISQSGFVENIANILKEYKQNRGLLPVKICILGPPAVGKTSIAEEVCKHYKLHHIKIKDVITEAIARLELLVAPKEETEEEQEETDNDEEEEENLEEIQELLDGAKESMEQNGGRLEDQYVIRFMKDKLKSMPCKNQGYILDGYPKTYDQAKDLFNQEEEEEEEESRGKIPLFDKLTIPEFVFALDASDEFLKERVMNLPEAIVVGTHYVQDRFLRSLSNFRDINSEDETVYNYFDELEIHPHHIDVGKFDHPQNKLVIGQIIKDIGMPRNYGLTDEEKAEEERKAAEERLAKEAAEEAEREHREAIETAEKIARWEEWNKRLEEVKREERELLEAQSVPLRNYLMTNVMPTLMRGLNECCKVRPDDPVDFLAEYLFKNNPEMD